MKLIYISTLITALSLTLGCSDSNDYSFKEVEDSRIQARVNGEFLAKLYRVENPRLEGYSYVVKTDTTISNSCINGDGWVSVSFIKVTKDITNKDTVDKIEVKCSTVSAGLGCYRAEDFQRKSISNEDGVCQKLNKVPYPLPKLIN